MTTQPKFLAAVEKSAFLKAITNKLMGLLVFMAKKNYSLFFVKTKSIY